MLILILWVFSIKMDFSFIKLEGLALIGNAYEISMYDKENV